MWNHCSTCLALSLNSVLCWFSHRPVPYRLYKHFRSLTHSWILVRAIGSIAAVNLIRTSITTSLLQVLLIRQITETVEILKVHLLHAQPHPRDWDRVIEIWCSSAVTPMASPTVSRGHWRRPQFILKKVAIQTKMLRLHGIRGRLAVIQRSVPTWLPLIMHEEMDFMQQTRQIDPILFTKDQTSLVKRITLCKCS